jgi:hypothetical protein
LYDDFCGFQQEFARDDKASAMANEMDRACLPLVGG